ncbi:MAG: hypothetical protein IPN68_17925 [Bacteroidetes bacterium]|nr:hypothetical protein [Bacteroidota bacterium]
MGGINERYVKAQVILFSGQGIKAVIATIVMHLIHVWEWIEPYFFGRDFVMTLTILLVGDMVIGIKVHMDAKDFSWKQMFHKFVFKLAVTAIATVSAKSIINIDHALDSGILVGAVKMTIALYLFGNLEKNLCILTKEQLCFHWLVERIKSIFSFFKK